MQTYIHTNTHAYIHAYIHKYIQHTYIHTCIHPYIHACIHTSIHTKMHTHIHTHKHTYCLRRCRWVPGQSAFRVALCGITAPPRSWGWSERETTPGWGEGRAEAGGARTMVQVHTWS